MQLAYVTTQDILNISSWVTTNYRVGNCGAAYHLAKTLESQSISIDYIKLLASQRSSIATITTRLKTRFYQKLFKRAYAHWAEPLVVREYASKISRELSILNSDVVLSPESKGILPIAYLKCKQPIVVWVDTTLAGLIDFYPPPFNNFCNETKKNIYAMEKAGLERCNLVIFLSDWAAKTAIKTYEIEPSKIRVVPWGANLEGDKTEEDINSIVEAKDRSPCKILFVGVDWFRKGGDTAIKVAQELNQMGVNTELLLAGSQPITNEPLPNFVKNLGFINKYTDEGISKMNRLFCESHFLIMPSRADCSPHVLPEANSFGLPCLATDIGGIPTIIKDDVNGKTFSLNASISEYCNYIASLMADYKEYKKLAYSSFNEYKTRLNWAVAGQTANQLISELL